jgi:hypothetical protein
VAVVAVCVNDMHLCVCVAVAVWHWQWHSGTGSGSGNVAVMTCVWMAQYVYNHNISGNVAVAI